MGQYHMKSLASHEWVMIARQYFVLACDLKQCFCWFKNGRLGLQDACNIFGYISRNVTSLSEKNPFYGLLTAISLQTNKSTNISKSYFEFQSK
jgi:hypothetical protein